VVSLPSVSFCSRKKEETSVLEERKTTESEIRDLSMQILYHRLGKTGSWKGSGETASFDLRDEFEGYECATEQLLSYDLPDAKIDHTSDILIKNEKEKKYISIEIKHRSAVTDQFKCHSYDMIHLKESYGDSLLG